MEKGKTKRSLIRGVLAALVTVAVMLLALQLSGTEASAQTVYTKDYDGGSGSPGDWEWDDSDGLRFKWMYYKLVNSKTGATLPKGWHKVDDCWFYFENGGYVFDEVHGGYYLGGAPDGLYYDGDPIIYTWKKYSKGWRYETDYDFEGESENYFWGATYRIDGKVYYFDDGGYIPNERGWYYREEWDSWYYIESAGNCATGWKKISGKWYFFDYFTGDMAVCGKDTSPIGQAGVTYSAFDENGVWIQGNGWKNIVLDYVYMKNSKCVTGWQKIGGKWYYFNPDFDAVMAASFIYDDDSHCYAYVDGYYMDTNGVCRDGGYKWHQDSKGWWYGKGSYYEKDTEAMIDNCYCQFDENGYLKYYDNRSTGEFWTIEFE